LLFYFIFYDAILTFRRQLAKGPQNWVESFPPLHMQNEYSAGRSGTATGGVGGATDLYMGGASVGGAVSRLKARCFRTILIFIRFGASVQASRWAGRLSAKNYSVTLPPASQSNIGVYVYV